MPNQKLNDVLSFLETRLATNSDLVGRVKVTLAKEPIPGVIKDYGVRIYVGSEKPFEVISKKIGNVVNEIFHTNVDFIWNRNLKTREMYSDAKGLSYWLSTIHSLLLHQTNSGAFVTSSWEFLEQDEVADSIILRGMHHCEVMSRY